MFESFNFSFIETARIFPNILALGCSNNVCQFNSVNDDADLSNHDSMKIHDFFVNMIQMVKILHIRGLVQKIHVVLCLA